jgi:hypothetical protein
MFALCLAGLVLSLLAMLTTRQVSGLLAPKKESVLAIPRTILSMLWLVAGPFIALIFALVFGLLLALHF